MANKITTILDLDAKGFSNTLKSIGKSVGEADTFMGKLKAGASSAMAGLKQYSAEAALAGAVIVGTFAVKAVAAFQQTALAAGQFSDAAGIAVEDASRWQEVANDLGIEGPAVALAIGRMNKAIASGSDVFKDFNIEIARTGAGVVDANQTFINAATTIGAIENPTLRSKAATDAFGRGFASIAQLMGASASDLRTRLDSVSSAQVIDEKELRKAREMRDAVENLKDAFSELALNAGADLIPALTEIAKDATPVVQGLGYITHGATQAAQALGLLSSQSDQSYVSFRKNEGAFKAAGLDYVDYSIKVSTGVITEEQALADLAAQQRLNIDISDKWANTTRDSFGTLLTSIDNVSGPMAGLLDTLDMYGARAEEAAAPLRELEAAQNDLSASLDDTSSVLGINTALDSLNTVLSRTPGNMAAVQSATVAAQQSLLAFVTSTELIPTSKKMEILTLINQGQLAEASAAINDLTRGRVIPIAIKFVGQGEVGFDKGDLDTTMKSSWAKAVGSLPKLTTGGGGGGGGGASKTPAELAEEQAQAWDKITKAMFEQNAISLADYRNYLNARIGAYVAYTDEYNTLWNEIDGLNKDEADTEKKANDEFNKQLQANIDAREKAYKAQQQQAEDAARAAIDAQNEADRLAAVKHEFGATTDADYVKFLESRLTAYSQYSEEWVRITRELEAVKQKAADADAARNAALNGTSGLQDAMLQQYITMIGNIDPATQQVYEMQARRTRQATLAGTGLK